VSERENIMMDYDSEQRKMWINKNKEVSLSNHILNPKWDENKKMK
jgi:hypothetical protein